MDEIDQADALEQELTDEEKEFLTTLADRIVKMGMLTPAMFFLESSKPLAYVGSQMMYFFRPIISLVWWNPISYDKMSRLLERRGAVELLIRRLEERA